MTPFLERYFGLSQSGTDVRTEVTAGATTFLTMAYIAFVNPQILSEAGMPFDAVFVATCLGAAFSTLLMGLYANYPIALAPGMGLNAFFTYGVVLGMGHTWEVALGAVFVAGVLFLVLSVVRVRQWIVESVPGVLKLAISAGIGVFLGVIALSNAGIIQGSPATLVTTGELLAPAPILALLGFCAIVALTARGVPGGVLIGILGVTAVGLVLGVSEWRGIVSAPPDPTPTLFALDIAGALQGGMIAVILTFLIVDLFDTTGTLIGVGQQANLLDAEGRLPRINRALVADSAGTVGGALLGTSPVTSYIESAAGTAAGGRTGLTAVVVAGAVPRLPVLRAARPVHSALRDGGGDSLRGVPDGEAAREPGLGRRHRVRPRGDDRAGHSPDLFHRRRHRRGLPDLRRHQGAGGTLERLLAGRAGHRRRVRREVRLALTMHGLAARRRQRRWREAGTPARRACGPRGCVSP